MGQRANVTSIEAVGQLKVALQQFEADAREALTELLLELRRAVQWVDVDRAQYWPRQVRKATDQVSEARINLERRKLSITPGDEPACYEAQKALEQAQQRLRFAQQKLDQLRHWRIKIKEEAEEFETQLARLGNYLDTELPRHLATLERMLKALERYAAAGGPAAASVPPPPAPAAPDTAQGEPEP